MHQKLCCIFCVRSKTYQYTTFHVITTPFHNDIKHVKKILKDLLFSRNLREIGNNGKFSLESFQILFQFFCSKSYNVKCTYFYTLVCYQISNIHTYIPKKVSFSYFILTFSLRLSFIFVCNKDISTIRKLSLELNRHLYVR